MILRPGRRFVSPSLLILRPGRGFAVAGIKPAPLPFELGMPLYEYVCRDCRHPFEVLQRMGETGDELRCPACGAVGAERQLSTFAGRSSAGAVTAGAAPAPACGAGGFT